MASLASAPPPPILPARTAAAPPVPETPGRAPDQGPPRTGAAPAMPAPPQPQLTSEQARKVAEYERLIGINRQARAAYLQLAKVYLDAGRKDLAAATFRRYLEIDPGNHFVRNQVEQLEGRAAPTKSLAGPSTAQLQAERRHAERMGRKLGIAAGVVGLLVVAFLLRQRIFPSARLIAHGAYANHDPFWSPDGRRLGWFAAKGDRGTIGMHDFETGVTREFPLQTWGMGERPRWSRDGLEVLLEGYSGADGNDGEDPYWGPVVKAMSVLDGSTKEIARGSHAAYTRDGRSLVMLCPAVYPRSEEDPGQPEHMCRMDLLSGRSTRIHGGEFSDFELQPGGDRIVFQVDRPVEFEQFASDVKESPGSGVDPLQSLENIVSGSGRVGDLEKGAAREADRLGKEDRKRGRQGDGSWWMPAADLWTVQIDGSGLGALTTDGRSVLIDWTPDGQAILFLHQPEAGQKPEVWMMDASGGTRRRVLPPSAEVVDQRGVAVTPDGRNAIFLGVVGDVNPGLLAALSNSPPFDLFVVDLPGENTKRLKNMHSFKSGFALSPDGRRIAYEYVDKKSGQPEIWLMKR